MSDLIEKVSSEVKTNYSKYQFIVVISQILVGIITLFFVVRAVAKKGD